MYNENIQIPPQMAAPPIRTMNVDEGVEELFAMGFDRSTARDALESTAEGWGVDINAAIDYLEDPSMQAGDSAAAPRATGGPPPPPPLPVQNPRLGASDGDSGGRTGLLDAIKNPDLGKNRLKAAATAKAKAKETPVAGDFMSQMRDKMEARRVAMAGRPGADQSGDGRSDDGSDVGSDDGSDGWSDVGSDVGSDDGRGRGGAMKKYKRKVSKRKVTKRKVSKRKVSKRRF